MGNNDFGPFSSVLLVEPATGPGRQYLRYNLTPYIDVSPGAFAPLRFTSDNSTLAPGETTWGWMAASGMLLWSPTGDMDDVPQDDNGGISFSQGWQIAPTTTEGVFQIYWNQTRFELNDYVSRLSWPVGQCHGDYTTPYHFVDDL